MISGDVFQAKRVIVIVGVAIVMHESLSPLKQLSSGRWGVGVGIPKSHFSVDFVALFFFFKLGKILVCGKYDYG